MGEMFVSRQVILDRDKNIFGYDVSLDDNGVRRFRRGSSMPVSSAVLFDALNDTDLERVLSRRVNFIQVDDSLLISPILESLNKQTIAFQIPQKVVVDADFVEYCRTLSEQGFSFCLELTDENQVMSPFLSLCRFVKMDIGGGNWEQIADRVRVLKKFDLRLVATPTRTRDEFERCSSLGFDLFGGNFFVKQAMATKKTISPSQALLLELSSSLTRNDDIDVIERLFKKNPELTFGLLKLINSAFFRVRDKVTSIRQAIALLGYDNLKKWVALLMFSVDYRDSRSNPLFERALLRGRLMELLSERSAITRGVADSAFVTGILSLVDVLFQISPDEVVEKLNISVEMQDALLRREGPLGLLLLLLETLDDEEYEKVGECLTKLNMSVRDLWSVETRAIVEYEKSNDQPI